MRIDRIASNAKYRKDKQFQKVDNFLRVSNFSNLLIFEFDNQQTFKILTISKLSNFQN